MKAFSAVAAAVAAVSLQAQEVAEKAFDFLSSSGVCQGSPSLLKGFDGSLSWDRHDFSWGKYCPKRGEYDEAVMDKFVEKVAAYRAAGKELLPIFAYGTDWAADRNASFEAGRKKFVYYEDGAGKVHRKLMERQKDGSWLETKDAPLKSLGRVPIAVETIPDWEDFVRRSVKRLMAPPCDLRYFQVWNEAHPDSGFWDGDMDSYMRRIHLPAAKAIRELGGKVVYGGWPCCGSLSSLVELLDRHNAWESIDVIDVHYFPLSAFPYLRKEALKRGRDIGVWQTEVAFTSNKLFIASLYPRFLRWCLENEPSPDKYKLFFFAASSPDDPKAYGYGRTLLSGSKVSLHGASLKTLGELFGAEPLSIRTDASSSPFLKPERDERLSSMEAFQVGKERIVVALHVLPNNSAKIFVDWNANDDTMHLGEGRPLVKLSFAALPPSRVAKAERVSFAGERLDISESLSASEDGKGCVLNVPVREPKKAEADFAEMPEDVVKDSFYAVLHLKP